MNQDPADRPAGVLPGGAPDDDEQSTPGSDGDGPEPGYAPVDEDEAEPGTEEA